MEQWINKHLPRLVSDLSPCRNCPVANTEKMFNLPGQKAVVAQLENLVGMLFPGCHGHAPLTTETAEEMLRRLLAETALQLRDQVQRAGRQVYVCDGMGSSAGATTDAGNHVCRARSITGKREGSSTNACVAPDRRPPRSAAASAQHPCQKPNKNKNKQKKRTFELLGRKGPSTAWGATLKDGRGRVCVAKA